MAHSFKQIKLIVQNKKQKKSVISSVCGQIYSNHFIHQSSLFSHEMSQEHQLIGLTEYAKNKQNEKECEVIAR